MNDIANIKKKVKSRLKNKPGKSEKGFKHIIESNFIHKCLGRGELGDAELFKKLYRDDFVFNKAMDCWLSWAGHHWQIDKMDHALASVEGVAIVYQNEAKKIFKEIQDIKDGDSSIVSINETRQKVLNRRAIALRSKTRRHNCLHFAHTSKDPLAIDGLGIDQKPWLLPCANGVINLKTGELEPGKQEDMLLKSSPVTWKGIEAVCPLWEKTLLEIFSGNPVLVDFLQRLCGFSLIGEALQSILVVLTGRGRNGKSMIIEIISKIMGQLSGAIRSEMLLDQFRTSSSSAPTPDIMSLRGMRLAFAAETDEHAKISPSKVKWLTGNDTLSGRNPHDKYEQQFKPTHTLFLLTNNKPHAPAEDFAFWERVVLIPFELSFVNREPNNEKERKADPYLLKKLEMELSGILSWMVRGCLDWQNQGLNFPAIVREAVSEYRKDEDAFGDFFDECCIESPEYETRSVDVYAVFEEWWKINVSNNVPKLKRLGSWLSKRFEKRKKPKMTYFGFGLLSDSEN